MLRLPREKFVNGPHRPVWERLITEPAFEEATLAALNQMQTDMPIEATPNQSADCHQQMIGARKFLDLLTSIHKPLPNREPAPARGLDYNAGV